MSEPAKKMIVLRSSDNKTFELEEAAAVFSPTIKHLIEDDVTDTIITVPDVAGEILAIVVAYCKKLADSSTAAVDELEKFDWKLVDVDSNTLSSIIMAAASLRMKSMLQMGIVSHAGLMRGKTPKEIRRFFHIAFDLTPEEAEGDHD